MNTIRHLWVCIHGVRAVPVSRLNRGEDGSPKTARLGGVERLRLSSQSLKHAYRMAFRELLRDDSERLGVRTRELPAMVGDALAKEGVPAAVGQGMAELLQSLGRAEAVASGEGTGQTATLLFLAQDEIEATFDFARSNAERLVLVAPTAEAVAAGEGSKGRKKVPKGDGAFDRDAELGKLRKEYAAFIEARGVRTPIDVALFGRFSTATEIPPVDACVQVAHAVGTGPHRIDYDYFTAVDDRSKGASAGHLGEIELAAGTVYQHVSVDVAALVRTLGDVDVARRGVAALVRAVALVMPGGGANGTAPATPADYLDVSLRRRPPLNASAAFDHALRPTSESGLLDLSIGALRQRLASVARVYDEPGAQIVRMHLTTRPSALGSVDSDESGVDSLTDLVRRLDEAILAACGGAP